MSGVELEEALQNARPSLSAGRGIGTLGEKTLHAALKRWADDNPAHWEVPLPEGFVEQFTKRISNLINYRTVKFCIFTSHNKFHFLIQRS